MKLVVSYIELYGKFHNTKLMIVPPYYRPIRLFEYKTSNPHHKNMKTGLTKNKPQMMIQQKNMHRETNNMVLLGLFVIADSFNEEARGRHP